MPAWAWWAIGAYLALMVVVIFVVMAAVIAGAREDEFIERVVENIKRENGSAG